MHIFHQPSLAPGAVLLSEEESKHCIRVLRMKRGEQIELVDGKGHSATATIMDDNAKRCLVNVQHVISHTQQQPCYLHIAIAPTKNFERMEWFIEKAVEIGISEITFMQCGNSERTRINMDRCQKIAVSAMKQSQQWHLPVINEAVGFQDIILHTPSDNLRLIAYCEAKPSAGLTEVLTGWSGPAQKGNNGRITILIGPEGDFTHDEITVAKQAGFVTVSLGDNRLRTETAALLCVTAVHFLHQ